MPKINQEEYEILKGLDDKWKWIVRNDQWQLEVRKDKPFKKGHVWSEEVTNHSFSNDIDLGSFHFIQWNDINGHEEPYNIAELIREYEIKELRLAPSGTVIVDSFDESEEAEVKSKQELIGKWESAIEAAEFYGKGKEERLISYMKDFVSDLNQLDEPEALSQKWIEEHRKSYTMEDSVEISDLQNLLVPKQEELETKIQELIESYKQEEDAYSNPENGWIGGFIEDLKNLVEKEQKYHVTDGNDTLLCKSNGVVMTVGKLWAIGNEREAEYDLTEQEIKDYDERFWVFAEPVELEE